MPSSESAVLVCITPLRLVPVLLPVFDADELFVPLVLPAEADGLSLPVWFPPLLVVVFVFDEFPLPVPMLVPPLELLPVSAAATPARASVIAATTAAITVFRVFNFPPFPQGGDPGQDVW
jgi:hypothetical protein